MKKKVRLALLSGGSSGEREVSLRGGDEVYKALDHDKYDIRRYDPAIDLERLARDAREIDVAFILLHGLLGEDGTVQGFLDLLGIPYQGSGVLGSAMAMDKNLAKILYRNAGLKVADWIMVTPAQKVASGQIVSELGLPVVIKPVRQGSSLGMSIVDSPDDLENAIRQAFEYDNEVMVEQFIAGREITVGVIGNDDLTALPVVEIVPESGHRFFDYGAKYEVGGARETCPADLPDKVSGKAQRYGCLAHKALHLKGYSRTDMIVAGEDIYVLETNTIPGMTPTSLLPQAALAHGLSFSALLDRLIELAMEKR